MAIVGMGYYEEADSQTDMAALLPYYCLVEKRCPRKDLLVGMMNRAIPYVRNAERFFDR